MLAAGTPGVVINCSFRKAVTPSHAKGMLFPESTGKAVMAHDKTSNSDCVTKNILVEALKC